MDRKPILNGSMMQPWLAEDQPWTEQDWREELGSMADVGMDHFILQWTVNNTPRTADHHRDPFAYYPTEIAGIIPSKQDCVLSLLKAAQSHSLDVWLGLSWNKLWFQKYACDETWLQSQFTLSKQIVEELWTRYGGQHSATIAGFYMPLEMDNSNFGTTVLQDRMASQYQELLQVLPGGKKLMIAPYFEENIADAQKPPAFARMWGDILRRAPVHVLALQDGIGAGHCSLDTIADWLKHLRDTIRDNGLKTELWSDLETFGTCGSCKTEEFCPAPFERIERQFEKQAPFVSRFTCFSFNHFNSPKQAMLTKYKRYLKQ